MSGENEITEPVKRRGRLFLLGPPIALLVFSDILPDAILTDLIVYRTCLISLNINATECMMLRTNSGTPEAMDLEAKVEPYASTIVMTKTLLENVLPRVLYLFLGPWSDRGGRRPLLLATYSGFTLKFLILSFVSTWNISPWYLMVAWIPSIASGGSCTAVLTSMCYLTDTTTEKNRRVQFNLLEALLHMGEVMGTLTGPLIYKHCGYANALRTSAVCCAFAVGYTYFRIPESVKDTSMKSVRGLHKISLGKEIFKNTSSGIKGERLRRYVICLAIFTLPLNRLVIYGNGATEFLFTRARLGWNVQMYSYFYATSNGLRIIGLCAVSLRSLLSGVPDTLLAGIGLVSAMGSALTRSLVYQSWHMYLAVCIEMFRGITEPAIRSIISKFVPAQDIGKVFSFTALLEILSLLGGTPLYLLIYSHYLPPIYPSPVYLVSVSFDVLLILCVMCIEIVIRKSRQPPVYTAAAQEDL